MAADVLDYLPQKFQDHISKRYAPFPYVNIFIDLTDHNTYFTLGKTFIQQTANTFRIHNKLQIYTTNFIYKYLIV